MWILSWRWGIWTCKQLLYLQALSQIMQLQKKIKDISTEDNVCKGMNPFATDHKSENQFEQFQQDQWLYWHRILKSVKLSKLSFFSYMTDKRATWGKLILWSLEMKSCVKRENAYERRLCDIADWIDQSQTQSSFLNLLRKIVENSRNSALTIQKVWCPGSRNEYN